MPIEPKGTVNRSNKVIKNLRFTYHNIKELRIVAYSPDDEGKQPPTQVHLLLSIEGLPAPAVMRCKSPDTLGFLIEELARYRREASARELSRTVWPEAAPVDVSGEWPETSEGDNEQ